MSATGGYGVSACMLGIGAILGVMLGTRGGTEASASTAASSLPRAPPRPFGLSDVTENPISQYGLPSDVNVKVFRGYIASLNYERRIPNWVIERLSPPPSKSEAAADEEKKVSRAESKFYSDESVPEMFRSTNADYSKRGLSRGHLAPAQFHKKSQEEMNETFNLCTNIVPQDMTMNACDWYRLESMTKKLTREFQKGLYVITGPAFVPIYEIPSGKRIIQYEVVGGHDVAVPTHLFKCLLGVKEDNSTYYSCFLMPNEPISQEKPLTDFQVAPSYIERITGLQLFPKLSEGSSSWSSAPVMDLCRKYKCEGSYAAFSKQFRQVGRLRACRSEAEVKRVFLELYQEGVVDAAVEKELKAKLQELNVKDESQYAFQKGKQ